MRDVASSSKILFHREKVSAYLEGKPIFPATLELDLTDACSRKCKDCPSARSLANRHLDPGFIDRLFKTLEGRTRGLLLTGGEPTLSPQLPRVLHLARECGFKDIAVVTNGAFLHRDTVAEALLEHASTVRLSLYDRNTESCRGPVESLQRIRSLRHRIDRAGSTLRIGVSILTCRENAHALTAEAEQVRQSGAHWVYFHPTCTGWLEGAPKQVDQTGVTEALTRYQASLDDGFHAHFCKRRYNREPLHFDGYHAAHFLMVVGADGMNYLAPEVKYQPRHVLADLQAEGGLGFPRDRERRRRIAQVNSRAYPAIRSRHRGMLYSHVLEHFNGENRHAEYAGTAAADSGFAFPHIL